MDSSLSALSSQDPCLGEAEGPLLKRRQQQRQSARGVGVHWTRWSYVYLRRDELTPEAAPPQQQQQWVLLQG